jgi:hypothetical protein
MSINAIGSSSSVDLSQVAGTGGKAPAGGAQQSAASASTGSTKTYDKKDTNKDGTVSAQEELMYDLQHPGEYTQQASLKATASETSSTLNLSA